MSISEGSGVFAVIAATATIAYLGYRFGYGKAKHVQQKLPPGAQPTAVITELNIFPIKSCGGISLQSATLGPFGFKNDRRWMIVAADTKRFLTQRQVPKLSLVQPKIVSSDMLEIHAPGMEVFQLPYKGLADGPIYDVGIWSDTCRGVDEGDAAAEWFSKYIGQPVRLIRTPDDLVRPVAKTYSVEGEPSITGWADGFPFLVISEESLVQLNTWITEAGNEGVPMKRFRPNIVVAGCPAFDEDDWSQVLVQHNQNNSKLFAVKQCTRCKLTTVIPEQGVMAGPEPLATVQKQHKGTFGQNMVHEGPSVGRKVFVGDQIYVLTRKEGHQS